MRRAVQGFLDRELTSSKVVLAEGPSDGWDYCRRRYHFEENLRGYVKLSAVERVLAGPMDAPQLRGLET